MIRFSRVFRRRFPCHPGRVDRMNHPIPAIFSSGTRMLVTKTTTPRGQCSVLNSAVTPSITRRGISRPSRIVTWMGSRLAGA